MSPSRGLLVYSPVLAFSLVGLGLALRHPGVLTPRSLSVAVVASLFLMGKYSVWWGGWSFGPRLLSDYLPALVPFMGPLWGRIEASPALRWTFRALLGVSLAIQVIGVTCYPGPLHRDWNASPRDVDRAHERLWDWRDPQLLRTLLNGPQPPGFRA